MSMVLALEIVSFIFLITGALLCVIGGIGIIRFPDFYARTHAASITDTMGAGLMLTGLMIQSLEPFLHHGWAMFEAPNANPLFLCFKVALLGIFILLTSPTSGHALVKAAYAKGVKADKGGDDDDSR